MPKENSYVYVPCNDELLADKKVKINFLLYGIFSSNYNFYLKGRVLESSRCAPSFIEKQGYELGCSKAAIKRRIDYWIENYPELVQKLSTDDLPQCLIFFNQPKENIASIKIDRWIVELLFKQCDDLMSKLYLVLTKQSQYWCDYKHVNFVFSYSSLCKLLGYSRNQKNINKIKYYLEQLKNIGFVHLDSYVNEYNSLMFSIKRVYSETTTKEQKKSIKNILNNNKKFIYSN